MDRLHSLEQQVRDLTVEELQAFRDWFAAYDAEEWDRQLEADAASGKLDALADRALRAHANRQSKPL